MDLSVTNYTYRLPISKIDLISIQPTIFAITGTGFSMARDVYINGHIVNRFEVVNDGRLIAELPEGFTDTALTDVSISSSGPVAVTQNVSVDFAVSNSPLAIYGISALVQRFLKILLTTPGSSYENVDEGGGVRRMLGLADGEELSEALLTDAVTLVTQYMLEDPQYTSLPPSERLQEAEILNSSWDKNTQTANIAIKITNQLGESVESGVAV